MTAALGSGMEDVSCPLGCARDEARVLVGRDRLMGLPGEFAVVRCRGCGLLRTNPRPTPDLMREYYPASYGPHAPPPMEGPSSRSSLRHFVGGLFQWNAECLPALRPGRMLEVGCASGGFLRRMAARGWQVEGIEFSSAAAAAARSFGFRVHAGPLETAPDPQAPFDLVVAWMTVEHLYDPVGGLRKLREWTRPDGWLVLSTPNAGALEFRLFRDAWYALHLPNHLFHFTPRTLSLVLGRAGWRRERTFHQRLLGNLAGSLGYRLEEYLGPSQLTRALTAFPEKGGRGHALLYPLAWALSLVGQTGRMTVWARPA
jgi:2-polyprenyl-3-methyl-5-hydroxy-6-metoxy-1,4-benzoquinol methylase